MLGYNNIKILTKCYINMSIGYRHGKLIILMMNIKIISNSIFEKNGLDICNY